MRKFFTRLGVSVAVMSLCAPVSEGAVSDAAGWALVRVSVANVRENPGHASELGSQVIMGTPLKITGKSDGWMRVETPEGYKGYVIDNSLTPLTDVKMHRWSSSDSRVAVASVDQTYVYDATVADCGAGADARTLQQNRVTDIVNGSILELTGVERNGYMPVRLPDGRGGMVKSDDIVALPLFSTPVGDIPAAVIAFARSCMGTPYLWGGTSSKSMDCSGLVKAAYLSCGYILPRNASQQAKTGIAVPKGEANYLPGDLLFFGNPSTGRVNHVGIYIGDGRFIHCAGRVMESSLRPNTSGYLPSLTLLHVRRLTPETLRQFSLQTHPWYSAE